MRCRNIVLNADGTYDIVWFGKTRDSEKTYDNYVEKQEGVAKSLIQRLGVIQGELWYNISYGLPLLSKIRDKAIMDSAIVNIINDHPEVVSIRKYESKVDQKTHTYYFTAEMMTIYGEGISISSDYQM